MYYILKSYALNNIRNKHDSFIVLIIYVILNITQITKLIITLKNVSE